MNSLIVQKRTNKKQISYSVFRENTPLQQRKILDRISVCDILHWTKTILQRANSTHQVPSWRNLNIGEVRPSAPHRTKMFSISCSFWKMCVWVTPPKVGADFPIEDPVFFFTWLNMIVRSAHSCNLFLPIVG